MLLYYWTWHLKEDWTILTLYPQSSATSKDNSSISAITSKHERDATPWLLNQWWRWWWCHGIPGKYLSSHGIWEILLQPPQGSLIFIKGGNSSMKIFEFADRVDSDLAAHHEPLHLDLYCLPANLWFFKMIWLNQILPVLETL